MGKIHRRLGYLQLTLYLRQEVASLLEAARRIGASPLDVFRTGLLAFLASREIVEVSTGGRGRPWRIPEEVIRMAVRASLLHREGGVLHLSTKDLDFSVRKPGRIRRS